MILLSDVQFSDDVLIPGQIQGGARTSRFIVGRNVDSIVLADSGFTLLNKGGLRRVVGPSMFKEGLELQPEPVKEPVDVVRSAGRAANRG